MQNKNNIDILSELETTEEYNTFTLEKIMEDENLIHNNKIDELEVIKEKKGITNIIIRNIVFLFKYLATSTLIFAILLVSTNYSAYIDITMSYFNKDQLNKNSQLLISSVKASYIKEKIVKKNKIKMWKNVKHSNLYKRNIHSIKRLINNKTNKDLKLNINITPYENRLIIPKIGKNVPLLDVKNQQVWSSSELENIFMDELKDWVVRYPGTAKPGEVWNSFIFWHSSNFPWVTWDYNQVFALIDKITYGDEIIVYYGEKKYKYIVREKKVISPNNVSLLKNRDKDRSELTLMSCWPIGTTLNRMIIIWELVKE